MGHWARINENNIVVEVLVIKEAELDTGAWGDKSKWIKTSFNTINGKHYVPKEVQDFTDESSDQSKAIRYRFAGIGDVYDATNDVFYQQQPYPSWILNKTLWIWEAPITLEYTDDDESKNVWYDWDEDAYQADNTKGWVKNTPKQTDDKPVDP
tara:strand:+ start:102 stop:560 length:459 start_codon:yes stop_codon:yes gene_type:complete